MDNTKNPFDAFRFKSIFLRGKERFENGNLIITTYYFLGLLVYRDVYLNRCYLTSSKESS